MKLKLINDMCIHILIGRKLFKKYMKNKFKKIEEKC